MEQLQLAARQFSNDPLAQDIYYRWHLMGYLSQYLPPIYQAVTSLNRQQLARFIEYSDLVESLRALLLYLPYIPDKSPQLIEMELGITHDLQGYYQRMMYIKRGIELGTIQLV